MMLKSKSSPWTWRVVVSCGLCLMLNYTATAASVWKVEGGKAPLYLAGSIHFLRKGDAIPPLYQQVYDVSDKVLFEVELDRSQQTEMFQFFYQEGRCDPDKQIDDYLTPDVTELLADYLKLNPRLSPQIRRMKPWMASMQLTVNALTRLGATPELGIDQIYFRKSKHDGKYTAGLEDVKDHVKVLASLTPQEQNIFLKHSIQSLDETEALFEGILSAWQQGDQALLSEYFRDSMAAESSIIDKMLLKRNINWIKTIENSLDGDRPVMVIVGVGHLVGEGSVIDLLEKSGYTILQLNKNTMN